MVIEFKVIRIEPDTIQSNDILSPIRTDHRDRCRIADNGYLERSINDTLLV